MCCGTARALRSARRCRLCTSPHARLVSEGQGEGRRAAPRHQTWRLLRRLQQHRPRPRQQQLRRGGAPSAVAAQAAGWRRREQLRSRSWCWCWWSGAAGGRGLARHPLRAAYGFKFECEELQAPPAGQCWRDAWRLRLRPACLKGQRRGLGAAAGAAAPARPPPAATTAAAARRKFTPERARRRTRMHTSSRAQCPCGPRADACTMVRCLCRAARACLPGCLPAWMPGCRCTRTWRWTPTTRTATTAL